MHRKIIGYLLIFIVSFLFIYKVNAKTANVYLFYGEGCPHCALAEEYFDYISEKDDVKIYKYEVWYNDNNKKIMNNVSKYLDFNVRGVPFVIIDNTPIIGFSEGKTEQTYNYHIKLAQKEDFKDDVGIYLKVVDEEDIKIVTTKKEVKLNNFKKIINFIFENIINYCYISLLLVLIAILIIIYDKKYF